MKKEIGGYFSLEKTITNTSIYHEKAIKLNLSRNALLYILRIRNYKKLYIPFFLCNSIEDSLKKNNINFTKYHINKKFLPILTKRIANDECVYVVNYYGLLDNKTLRELQKRYKNIIIDNVQAFFQKPIRNIDTIYSYRKFFGVPDGSLLYTNSLKRLSLNEDNSELRFKHLIGRQVDGAQKHYEEFQNLELYFNELNLLRISKETNEITSHIDYMTARRKRSKNFLYLSKKLSNANKLSLPKIHGAFCYPLLVSDGNTLRNMLIKNGIFVPKYWPNLEDLNKFEEQLANNILPIPCDQRYNVVDMKQVSDILLEEIKNGHLR